MLRSIENPGRQLRKCAVLGRFDLLQKLLAIYTDSYKEFINERSDSNGNTALIWAVECSDPSHPRHNQVPTADYPSSIKLLLDFGADDSLRNSDGKTVYHFLEGHDDFLNYPFSSVSFEREFMETQVQRENTEVRELLTRFSQYYFRHLLATGVANTIPLQSDYPLKVFFFSGDGCPTAIFACKKLLRVFGHEMEYLESTSDLKSIEFNNVLFQNYLSAKFLHAHKVADQSSIQVDPIEAVVIERRRDRASGMFHDISPCLFINCSSSMTLRDNATLVLRFVVIVRQTILSSRGIQIARALQADIGNRLSGLSDITVNIDNTKRGTCSVKVHFPIEEKRKVWKRLRRLYGADVITSREKKVQGRAAGADPRCSNPYFKISNLEDFVSLLYPPPDPQPNRGTVEESEPIHSLELNS